MVCVLIASFQLMRNKAINKSQDEFFPHLLNPNEKRIFFEGIKKTRPALATLMNEDAFIKGLRSRFGGEYVFKRKEFDEIYQAGQQVVAEIQARDQT